MSLNTIESSSIKLNKSLSPIETWAFGLTGHVGWIGTVPVIHAALGQKALWVWIPGVIVSFILNLQVKALGETFPEMSGGTPNYAARLLNKIPGLDKYVAIGYYIGWAAAPAIYAIILTDLIKANLEPLGIYCPEILLKIAFTTLPFLVGLSGIKALSVLHLFFAIPAVIFGIAYVIQATGWLVLSPQSPGLLPHDFFPPTYLDWAKWFFVSVYSVYSCETASSFVAESQSSEKTLKFLNFAAWLIPVLFLAGPMVLTALATGEGLGDNVYLNLSFAGNYFWGSSASFLVTLLIAFSCLLSSATAISNTPRILYQLSLDKHLGPLWSYISPKGVLQPGLLLTFLFSLICLIWGDVARVVMVTGTSYLICMIGFHLGIWLSRGNEGVRFAYLSLGFFFVEVTVLLVGGLAWNKLDFLIGLIIPAVIIIIDFLVQILPVSLFNPRWWSNFNRTKNDNYIKDFVTLQVFVLLILICSATTFGWFVSAALYKGNTNPKQDILAVLLITLSFIGVAIACWTTLPQVSAIAEAREIAFKSQDKLTIQAQELQVQKQELEKAISELQKAQAYLIQTEKMSSIGQLVTGISLEINGFISSIYSNVSYSKKYIKDVFELLNLYKLCYPEPFEEISKKSQEIDIELIPKTIFNLADLTELGAKGVDDIVKSLQRISSTDKDENTKKIDIHDNINTNLMILKHRLINTTNGMEIKLIKKYSKLPDIECYPGQLNQALMNIFTYCIDSCDDVDDNLKKTSINSIEKPQIRILTQMIKFDWVRIQISHNGPILPDYLQQFLFDSSFTGNNFGKGNRLGLLISHKIITEKHQGRLKCISSPGKGTAFIIDIPTYQDQ
jgi:signal transduction histidine kinase